MAGATTRIAVLPLAASSSSAAPYLADALTEQVIDALGGLNSLRVTSAASSAKFKGSTAPIDEIARQLAVDVVVTGTVTSEAAGPHEPIRARVETQVTRSGSRVIPRPCGPDWRGSSPAPSAPRLRAAKRAGWRGGHWSIRTRRRPTCAAAAS